MKREGGSVFLSVVIPAYNEEAVIAETLRRVTAVCDQLGGTAEVIVVNDGSRDATWAKLREIAARDPRVVGVNLSRNHGHQLALAAGLHFARGERTLIMDADLQDPPELLPSLMAEMDRGADVVYAQRRSRPGDAPLKRIFCAVFYRLLSQLSSAPVQLDTGDFRLLSRRVVDTLRAMPERQPFLRGMVSWVGFRQTPVFYDRDARFAGESKYPVRKLVALAIDGVVSSSLKPLAFATVVGGLALLVGCGLAAYAVYSWIWVGRTPQGWTSLLVAVVVLGSLQLLVLGILGEYLGRIYFQTRGRPLFLVGDVVGGPGAEGPEAARSVNSRLPDGAHSAGNRALS